MLGAVASQAAYSEAVTSVGSMQKSPRLIMALEGQTTPPELLLEPADKATVVDAEACALLDPPVLLGPTSPELAAAERAKDAPLLAASEAPLLAASESEALLNSEA